MTDRIQSLTVVLEGDVRTDDVEILIQAITMIRGVQKVVKGEPVSVNDFIARERAAMKIREALWKAFDKETK